MISLILKVLAFVLFLVAAAGVNLPRINFGWAGLACLTLSEILGAYKV